MTDTRTIVVQNRIDMLKKQANSLSTHQVLNADKVFNLCVFSHFRRQEIGFVFLRVNWKKS